MGNLDPTRVLANGYGRGHELTVKALLIGYFAKRITLKPDWISAPAIVEICSVSDCIAPAPENWIQHWTHNELWVYDTVAAARAVIPAGEEAQFAMYAYRIVPVIFSDGVGNSLEIPAHPEALPPAFTSLGFDVVSRSVGTNFECSPLSCCDLAGDWSANQFCLLSDLDTAIAAATTFSVEQPEPGPYVVIEVLREHRTPSAA
jgi:hypothetical protein